MFYKDRRMVMDIKQISCPSCGAPIQTVNSGNISFCCYCGSKLIFSNKLKNKRKFVHKDKSVFDLCCEKEEDRDKIQETLQYFYNKDSTCYYRFIEDDDKHVIVILNDRLLGYIPDEYVDDFEWCIKFYDNYYLEHKITRDYDGIYTCEMKFLWGEDSPFCF